jgi:ankyrin repeat protein
LHCAVLSGSFETCAFLVGFSECNIKAIDDLNRTAVDIAWKNGKAEIVEYFQTIPKCPQLAITVGAEQIEID